MPDKVMWPIENGQQVETEIVSLGTTFRAIAGVYIMCARRPDGRWTAIYVGQSHNLNERVGVGLNAHHALPSALRHGATHICVKAVASAYERDRLEKALCKSLQPPVNSKLVA